MLVSAVSRKPSCSRSNVPAVAPIASSEIGERAADADDEPAADAAISALAGAAANALVGLNALA
jgi:hypothetical protein